MNIRDQPASSAGISFNKDSLFRPRDQIRSRVPLRKFGDDGDLTIEGEFVDPMEPAGG